MSLVESNNANINLKSMKMMAVKSYIQNYYSNSSFNKLTKKEKGKLYRYLCKKVQ